LNGEGGETWPALCCITDSINHQIVKKKLRLTSDDLRKYRFFLESFLPYA